MMLKKEYALGNDGCPDDDDCPVGADEALSRLMEGNARFLRGKPRFTRAPSEILADLIKGQHPFAAILGCSNSRVPPELILDAKFGTCSSFV